MDENQNQVESTPASEAGSPPVQAEVSNTKKGTVWAYVLAALVVVGILAGVVVYLNGQTADDTSGIDPSKVVATVNGADIVGADLTTSISQITATAQLQGIDTTDPNVQAEIQNQAVQMLVNTELLEQEADERGINITDQAVDARIAALVDEIGSEEALKERMEALGIDDETLESDVKSELLIQELLDQVFESEQIDISEEEILSFYEATTGGGETATPIEEVRPQIEAQIRVSKEQAIVDQFISDLRSEAAVEIPE